MVRIIYIFIFILISCNYTSYRVTINNNVLNNYDTNYVIINKDSIVHDTDTLTEWNYKKIE